ARHADYVEGRQFKDIQEAGPFAKWEHTHRMIPDGEHSVLHDHVEYELPLGDLVNSFAAPLSNKQFDQLFAYRHRITKNDLQLHKQYASKPLRLLVTGATGTIGQALTSFLTTGGHEVLRLTRQTPSDANDIQWDPQSGMLDARRLEGLDAVIHLAGEPIAAPAWTERKKQRIRDSRVDGTALLARTLASLEKKPAVFVTASGVGYYGDTRSTMVDETGGPGLGFLAKVAQDWEAATKPAEEAGIRVVWARTGVVLTPAGGALRAMLPAFKVGLGAQIVDGDVFVSWISLDDVVGAFYHIIHTASIAGPVNLTAPTPVPFSTLAKAIGQAIRRPVFLKIPRQLARRFAPEAVLETALTSIRARPGVLTASGYSFLYGSLRDALVHQLGVSRHV
ncbi:MAG: TIGR01777 family oxidoreductase, partial [Bacteroidota bacterium]